MKFEISDDRIEKAAHFFLDFATAEIDAFCAKVPLFGSTIRAQAVDALQRGVQKFITEAEGWKFTVGEAPAPAPGSPPAPGTSQAADTARIDALVKKARALLDRPESVV